MAILQKLKSVLGLESSRSDEPRDRDVSVTVERRQGESDGESSTSNDGPAETDDTVDSGEPAAAGTTASSSTGSLTEEPPGGTEATEPAEAAGPTTGDAVPEADKMPDKSDGEAVDSIKGIGPSYAERLDEAGVETVAELATADADELAEHTDISAKRLQGWIDRAATR